MTNKKVSTRAKRWVFTCQVNKAMKELPPKEEIIDWLEKYSSDAVFQLEKGENTGRMHYQGRLTLKSPRISKISRNSEADSLKNQLDNTGLNFEGFTFEIEADEIASKAYCSKSKTRIEGPWRIGTDGEYQGDDLGLPFRPWQNSLKEFVDAKGGPDLSRIVVSIFDKQGNSGKSWWIKEMRVNHPDLKVYKLPTGNVDRLLSIVCKRMNQERRIGAFCIDLTRTRGKDVELQDIYHAIEEIKSGYIVDVMYGSGQESTFPPPKIILMHNNDLFAEYQQLKKDGKQYLSDDRYIFLEIKDRDQPICWRTTQNLELINKYIPGVLRPNDICYNKIKEIR